MDKPVFLRARAELTESIGEAGFRAELFVLRENLVEQDESLAHARTKRAEGNRQEFRRLCRLRWILDERYQYSLGGDRSYNGPVVDESEEAIIESLLVNAQVAMNADKSGAAITHAKKLEDDATLKRCRDEKNQQRAAAKAEETIAKIAAHKANTERLRAEELVDKVATMSAKKRYADILREAKTSHVIVPAESFVSDDGTMLIPIRETRIQAEYNRQLRSNGGVIRIESGSR